jgi:hypothetical protein
MQRIEQLEDRDRRAAREALGEVVALEQLRDRRRARERGTAPPSHVEPLGVEAQLVALGSSSRTRNACSWYVRALASISSPTARAASTSGRSGRRRAR